MEVVLAPEKRGQGKGSKLLKEFLENAGFKLSHTHKDQDGESMLYVYDGGVND